MFFGKRVGRLQVSWRWWHRSKVSLLLLYTSPLHPPTPHFCWYLSILDCVWTLGPKIPALPQFPVTRIELSFLSIGAVVPSCRWRNCFTVVLTCVPKTELQCLADVSGFTFLRHLAAQEIDEKRVSLFSLGGSTLRWRVLVPSDPHYCLLPSTSCCPLLQVPTGHSAQAFPYSINRCPVDWD